MEEGHCKSLSLVWNGMKIKGLKGFMEIPKKLLWNKFEKIVECWPT